MRLEVRPLSEPVGAIMTGWNPDEELAPEDRETILRGLRQHLVLVFRGHRQPSDAALVRFARSFGDLVKGTVWFGDMVEFPEILPITNIDGPDGVPRGTGGSVEFGWHADYSYVERVGKESFLEAVELPREAAEDLLLQPVRRAGDAAPDHRGDAQAVARLSQPR